MGRFLLHDYYANIAETLLRLRGDDYLIHQSSRAPPSRSGTIASASHAPACHHLSQQLSQPGRSDCNESAGGSRHGRAEVPMLSATRYGHPSTKVLLKIGKTVKIPMNPCFDG
jgi:hypothetical protein